MSKPPPQCSFSTEQCGQTGEWKWGSLAAVVALDPLLPKWDKSSNVLYPQGDIMQKVCPLSSQSANIKSTGGFYIVFMDKLSEVFHAIT